MRHNETICLYEHELTREPNMNTDTIQSDYEDAQYRIFMRWLVTLAVLIVATTACYVMVGCNPDQYPGAPEASAAPHGEQGDIRTLPK